MYGRHYDTRVHPHFVQTYSKVPHLDSEIFHIQVDSLKQSRRAQSRSNLVQEGLARASSLSNTLGSSLKESRRKREEEDHKFIADLENSHKVTLEKEKESWQHYSDSKVKSRIEFERDQIYLDDLLKSNSTKAASRLSTVRRWY